MHILNSLACDCRTSGERVARLSKIHFNKLQIRFKTSSKIQGLNDFVI